MTLLNEDVTLQLQEEFAKLVNPVRLAVAFQTLEDPESEQVKRLVEELAALDPKLSAEPLNFVLDKERCLALGLTRTPAVAILGADKDYGVRFYGLPTGYEFGSLVDAILLVSSGESGLSDETKLALKDVDKAIHIQVFSTPTCPYCPRATRLAWQFAMEKDNLTADGVEVTGFPDLARRYEVRGVPKTVVGETAEFVGAGPEAMLLSHVQRAALEGGLVV